MIIAALSLLASPGLASDEDYSVLPLQAVLDGSQPPTARGPALSHIEESLELRLQLSEEDELSARVSLQVLSLRGGWTFIPVLDASWALEAPPPELLRWEDRWVWMIWLEPGETRTLRVEGRMKIRSSAQGEDQLLLGPASRRSVFLSAPEGLTLEGENLLGETLPASASHLKIRWGPPREPSRRPAVVQAVITTLARPDEERLELQSRVEWQAVQGEVDRHQLELPAGLGDLSVRVSGGWDWTREGDRLTLTAREESGSLAWAELAWEQALQESQSLQAPEVIGAQQRWILMEGSLDGALVPRPHPSLRPLSLRSLSDWTQARGEVRAAWTGGQALRLDHLSLEPAETPDLLIDRLDCEQVWADSGTALMRCGLTLRNTSRQYLSLGLPADSKLWLATQRGEALIPVHKSAREVLLPLERSLETLEGLTSQQLDVLFWQDRDPWESKEQRRIQLPWVDAPVASLELTLRPPPGSQLRYEGGSLQPRSEDSPGLRYGRRAEASLEPAPEETARPPRWVDQSWERALDAYRQNDFQGAQRELDQLRDLDPSNENALRLQSNLDVLTNQRGDGEEEQQARRIKELAGARASEQRLQQTLEQERLEEALLAGEYEEAERRLGRLDALNEQLSYTEEKDSQRLEAAREEAQGYRSKVKRKKDSTPKRAPANQQGMREIDFEAEEAEVALGWIEIEGVSRSSGGLRPGRGGGEVSGTPFGAASPPPPPPPEPAELAAPPPAPSPSAAAAAVIDLDDAAPLELQKPQGALLLNRMSSDVDPMEELMAELEAAQTGQPPPPPPLRSTDLFIPLPQHTRGLELRQTLLASGQRAHVELTLKELP